MMVVFNDKGEELPDDRPMSSSVSFKRPPSISDMVKRLVRSEQLNRDFEAHGIETFDEADDFNVGDDMDMSSPWEENFDPEYPHIAARLSEVRSGVVQDITPKEIAVKIAELKAELSNLRAEVPERRVSGTSRILPKASKGKKVPKAPTDSGDYEDEVQ